MNKEKIIIPRMDLVLTTKCSLKCESCANLMQYYQVPYDVPLDNIKKYMGRLAEICDEIRQVYVIGGEPFLYPGLYEVCSFLNDIQKIKEVIIVTNGTISPDNIDVWDIIQNKKYIVRLSDYGILSRHKESIVEKCKQCEVRCSIDKKEYFYDTGSMKARNRSKAEIQKVFADCGTLCRSLLNNEFHYCPRSSHGTDLKLIPKRDIDYIDLDDMCDNDELKSKLFKFLNRENYIEACNYCDIRTPGYYERQLPLAKQTKTVLTVGGA